MKCLILGLLLAVPAKAQRLWPESWKPYNMANWGGVNLLEDSKAIDGDAQDALNVLTDNTWLEKRPGNVLLGSFGANFPVNYVNEWVAPSGTRYLIGQSSLTVYETNFSGSPVALSTVAAGYNLTFTPAFSKAYFADGNKPIWFWNGTSTGVVTDAASGAVAPICTYTAFKDNRLWCANITNVEASQVDVSSAGGAGYFVVPPNASQIDNAPNQFLFTPDDGDSIRCLATTPWGMFVGKRNSTYMIRGNGNLTYDARVLDPKIGCLDNRSVQMVYGVLKWLSADGVYGYAGAGQPRLISRELDPLLATGLVRQGASGQGVFATSLASDWQSGTTSSGTNNLPTATWDDVDSPGTIFPSSFTLLDTNRSPYLQGGIGFSSDTLVNIDTTTQPLSVGWAQLAPSSGGVQIWNTPFTNGNFSTGASTWTVSAGSFGSNHIFVADIEGLSAGNNEMYNMAASTPGAPSPNGWNYGYWTIYWQGVAGGNWGACNGSPSLCLEYDFISDKTNTSISDGYGISVNQTGGVGATTPFTLTLYKSLAGVRTILGTYSFTQPTSLNFSSVGYSTFTVSRTPGGYFNVGIGTVTVIQAQDNTPVANNAVMSLLILTESGGGNFNHSFGTQFQGYGTGSIVSQIFNTGQFAPLASTLSSTYTLTTDGATAIAFYVRSSSSPNNDFWSSWKASSNTIFNALPNQYWQWEGLFSTSVASETPTLSSVQLIAVSTGNYYSKVDFIGSLITSWGSFAVNENNPGTYNYWVREATYSFAPGATSPSWSAQTANQIVNLAVSTPTYVQFRLDSSNLTKADLAESISAVFMYYNQGANIPVASSALNRRYMLCVTISTASSTPDTCMLQQKNNKWMFWKTGFPTPYNISAMGLYNNSMIAADGGITGNVWSILQPGVYNDAGQPINSYWVSGDFAGDDPFTNDILHEFWVDATPISQSSVTASWQVNKLPSWNSFTFSLDNGIAPPASNYPAINAQSGSVIQRVPVYDFSTAQAQGKFVRFMFSDMNQNTYFRINSYESLIENQPRMY